MNDTSGFYKLDNTELLFAPNFVYAPAYTLLREQQDLALPVDGWDWHDTEDAARAAFGI